MSDPVPEGPIILVHPTTVRVLEIGGTHVTAASVDVGTWQVRERNRTGLDSGAPAAHVVATVSATAMSLPGGPPAAWAIAIPGPFDYARGVALFRDVGKFDALHGFDLGRALGEAITPRPVSITFVHDTEAFLLGEWTCGAASGAHRCAAVTLGSGVGSAFLADGRRVRSGPGMPPDGRIHRVQVDGAPLEDAVSRRAIRAAYAARTGDAASDVREIAARARAGDKVAGAVLDRAFRTLGRVLAPAVDGFVPDVVVVGGSMSASWELIAPPLSAGLAERGVTGVVIRPARRRVEAPLVGAARAVVDTRTEVTA